ncbi:hypothetical protein [Streptomyces sp. NPDC048295]|uniref:hypothetical protein n=1 Tax=Streptomyces sp. NPDC048295 TaxID=3154617 RepID=UPI003440C761
MAAAVVGGVIALARTHATATAAEGELEPEPDVFGGVLAEVARILAEAAVEQDDSSRSSDAPPRAPYAGPVSGYWRDQCLNPRGHATGNCTHERRWVDEYTKGAREEAEDIEV